MLAPVIRAVVRHRAPADARRNHQAHKGERGEVGGLMIAFHNSLVGNNEGRYEMTKAIVEIEHLMAPILDGMDSKLRPRP